MSDQYFKTMVLNRPATDEGADAPRGVLRCVDTSVLDDASGAQIRLDGREVTIGRGTRNMVVLDAEGVSRKHARLFVRDGAWHVEDLGSTNGTRVNNSRIDECPLADGDTVAFGRVCYKFHVEEIGAGTSSTVDLDLGGMDRTLVMRPGQSPGADLDDTVARAAAKAAARAPGAEQIYESGTRRHTAHAPEREREPDPTPRSGAGPVIVVVVLLAAAAAAAWFFGVL